MAVKVTPSTLVSERRTKSTEYLHEVTVREIHDEDTGILLGRNLTITDPGGSNQVGNAVSGGDEEKSTNQAWLDHIKRVGARDVLVCGGGVSNFQELLALIVPVFDVVEIVPELVDWNVANVSGADQWNWIKQDYRDYLNSTTKKYDAIAFDIDWYNDLSLVDEDLLKGALTDGGIILMSGRREVFPSANGSLFPEGFSSPGG